MNDAVAVLESHLATDEPAIGSDATASAIAAWVSIDATLTIDAAMGVHSFAEPRPITVDTPFDIASVTKLFTATLAQIAVDEGRIEFDTPVGALFDEWRDGDKAAVTLLQLMNHSSGLPAWDKFYLRFPIEPDLDTALATRASILDEILATNLEATPGTRHTYSDLGYILLGWLVERALDAPLEELVRDRIARPLGLESVRYVSLERDPDPVDAPATERDPLRGRLVRGQVHDENCYVMGGVAGHAGLFATARDVGTFGAHMLAIDAGSRGIVSNATLEFCWSEAARGAKGNHLGGWDTPSGAQSSAGRGFGPATSVGHLGFTGTSLWIERRRRIISVLLTNRVYPTRENALIKPLRVAFHEAIAPPET